MFGSSLSYLSWYKDYAGTAKLTMELAFAITEEGTSVLNETFGSGKSSLAGLEMQ